MSTSLSQVGQTSSNQHTTSKLTYSLMKSETRLLTLCLFAVCVLVCLDTASAFEEPDFYPMESRTWRQFAHRRPHPKFDRSGRDIPDRTCGAMLAKRTQLLCSLDCPPPGMSRIVLAKRSAQKKTLLTDLCCNKPCTDELIRQIFCCSAP